MKALLLTDGFYPGLEDVKFPVEVEVIVFKSRSGNGKEDLLSVTTEELLRIGGDPLVWNYDEESGWLWVNNGVEAEIIEE